MLRVHDRLEHHAAERPEHLGRVRLAGAAVLNPTQLEAVNDREVCWGVHVTGRDLAAMEDGTANVHFEVKKLMLQIRFSVI